MRESAANKARRYLAEGRVIVRRVTDNTAIAHVRGDGATYTVMADRHGWRCNCPARTRCAHQVALGLITSLALPDEEER